MAFMELRHTKTRRNIQNMASVNLIMDRKQAQMMKQKAIVGSIADTKIETATKDEEKR